ncbi:hypothetical protein HMPREF2861_08575 [Lactobacillus sp. HMSC068F07]|nr:hypothetical protein HMPREF2861_08575 [Lactobacillus sp. HMSC068F07]
MTLFKLFWLIGHLFGEYPVELFCDFKVAVGVKMIICAERRFDVLMPQEFFDLERIFTEAGQQRHMQVAETVHGSSLYVSTISINCWSEYEYHHVRIPTITN